MRRSIRNQILIPLIAVQVGDGGDDRAGGGEGGGGSGRGSGREPARRAWSRPSGRSNFPLTGGVLEKMRGLSGAHFVDVATSRAGCSTRPCRASTRDPPDACEPCRPRSGSTRSARRRSWSSSGERYFAASVRSGRRPDPPGALPRGGLAAGPMGGELAAARLVGALSLAPMAAVTGLVAHRLGPRLRSVQERGRGDRGRRLPRAGRPRPARRGRRTRPLGQPDGRATPPDAARRSAGPSGPGVLAQLAAGLAHQLRNAATGARMAVQLHARRCPGPETDDSSLEVALRQLALCEEQVKGLLSMDRAEARSRRPVSTHPSSSKRSPMLVEPTCRHLGVELDPRRRRPARTVQADPEQLRAALLNLALNAIEAAGPGGESCSERPSRIERVCFDVDRRRTRAAARAGLDDLRAVRDGQARRAWDWAWPWRAGSRPTSAAGYPGSRIDGRTRFRLEIPRAVDEESA